MPDKNRNRRNEPPSGQRKHKGDGAKLAKRSVVAQAAHNHPELNLGDTGEEMSGRVKPRAKIRGRRR